MQLNRFVMAAFLTGLISLSSAAQISRCSSSRNDERVSLSAQVGMNLSRFTHVDRRNGIKVGVNVGVITKKPIMTLANKAWALCTKKRTIEKNDGDFISDYTTTFSLSFMRNHGNNLCSF